MPAAVAQVDEDQPAVVAAAVDPAGDADLAAGVGGAQIAGPGVAEPVGLRWLPHPMCLPRRTRATIALGRQLLLLSALHVLQDGPFVFAEDGDVARAGSVGLLELALARAPGELELHVEPGAARLGGQGERGRRSCPAT